LAVFEVNGTNVTIGQQRSNYFMPAISKLEKANYGVKVVCFVVLIHDFNTPTTQLHDTFF